MSEGKQKAIGPPMCKICGHNHWGVAHVWGGKPAPKHVVVVVPTPAAKSKKAVVEEMRKPIGLAASLDILMKPPALDTARAALAAAETRTAKPKAKKAKRAKPKPKVRP